MKTLGLKSLGLGRAIAAVSLVMLVLAAATAHAQPQQPTGGSQSSDNAQPVVASAQCPTEIQRSLVTTERTSDGIALVFRTDSDHVDGLVNTVDQLARTFNSRSGISGDDSEPQLGADLGATGAGVAGPGMAAHGMMAAEILAVRAMAEGLANDGVTVPARASAEAVPGGARLRFVPEQFSQLDALKREVEVLAGRMSAGECPVLLAATSSGNNAGQTTGMPMMGNHQMGHQQLKPVPPTQ
jgi:hypothetical protein